MNYIVAALVALAGIITAVTGLRKATEDSAAGAVLRYDRVIEHLERQLNEQGEEIRALKADRRTDRKRIEDLEKQRRLDFLHTDRLEDLLALSITYTDVLKDKMIERDIVPPPLPPELAKYLKERNNKEKKDVESRGKDHE